MRPIWLVPVAMVALAGSIATAGRSAQASAPVVTFGQVSPMLDRYCAACHNAEGAAGAGNLNLEMDQAYKMVGRKASGAPINLVTPGNPARSYLYAKLVGTQAAVGGGGDRMPMGQRPLSPDKLELVRTWIAGGAKR